MSAPLATRSATMSEARTGQSRGSGTRVGREADCKDGPKCGGDPIERSLDAGILGNTAEASLKAMRPGQAGRDLRRQATERKGSGDVRQRRGDGLSLIHISEPT